MTEDHFSNANKFMQESCSLNAVLFIAPIDAKEGNLSFTVGLVVMAITVLERQEYGRPRYTARYWNWLRDTFPDWALNPCLEIMDDFDFFLRYGRGSWRWAGCSKQWRTFLDAVGKINKRGFRPDFTYVEVGDFKGILDKMVTVNVPIPLVVPSPFNRASMDQYVNDWYNLYKADDGLSNFRPRKSILDLQKASEIIDDDDDGEIPAPLDRTEFEGNDRVPEISNTVEYPNFEASDGTIVDDHDMNLREGDIDFTADGPMW